MALKTGLRETDPGPGFRLSDLVQYPRWVIAVLFFGGGDVATTIIGLGMAGPVEAGPLPGILIELYGPIAIILVKLLVFTGSYLAWRMTPEPYRLGIPLGLGLVGIVVTAWNIHILIIALLI